MKLIDALLNVRKDMRNSATPDIESFARAASVPEYDVDWGLFSKGLVGYWVYTHMCTDTWVGLQAVYLHDELVAYTNQTARKNDVDLEFISEEAAKKTVAFVKSCCEEKDNCYYSVEKNLEQEIDHFNSVYYAGQLLEDKGFFKGRKCNALNKIAEPTNYCSTKIIVEFEDGQEQMIEASDFKYPLRVTL